MIKCRITWVVNVKMDPVTVNLVPTEYESPG